MNRREVEAELLGAAREVMQDTLAVLFLIIVLSAIDIGAALGKHGIDQPCEFMRGRGDRLGPIQARAEASIVGAIATVSTPHAASQSAI